MSAGCLPPINVTLKVESPYSRPAQPPRRACNQEIPVPCVPSNDFCSVPTGRVCPEGNEAEIVESLKHKFEPVYVPPAFPIDGRTTYKHSYVPHPYGFSKVQAIRPAVNSTLPRVFQQINDCKTEDLTWYRYQFPPHKVECYKKPDWSRRAAALPTLGPMFAVTCYSQAFQPKNGQPAVSAKPKHRFLNKTEEMNCSTTYQTAYQAWCPDRATLILPHNRPGFASDCCTPFRGITTYKADYRAGYQKPRDSYKPKFSAASGEFDSISTYRAAYEPYYFKIKPCNPEKTCDNKNTRQ